MFARFARKIMYLSMKLGVFSRVDIWPKFVDKDKFLRSDDWLMLMLMLALLSFCVTQVKLNSTLPPRRAGLRRIESRPPPLTKDKDASQLVAPSGAIRTQKVIIIP